MTLVKSKKILFCVSALGLGHATRVLPLIKYYAKENQIVIASAGIALDFLRDALKDCVSEFVELRRYPTFGQGVGLLNFLYWLKNLSLLFYIIFEEHRKIEDIVVQKEIDFLFSDFRYGCYSNKVPSFVLTHQILLAIPPMFKPFRVFVNLFQSKRLKKFTHIFVVDYKDKSISLAGDLSHMDLLNSLEHSHIGILSSVVYEQKEKDIDYLFIISGFLEEQNEFFIKRLIEESKLLEGKKVFILGGQGSPDLALGRADVEIVSYARFEERNTLLNRAKVIISRSGYTTVMDLVELGIKGVLIPTKNQNEQEYLAEYLNEKKFFATFSSQEAFTLDGIDAFLRKTSLPQTELKTIDSLKKVNNVVNKYI